MATDPSTLPQWKGKPVPWVARWTQEKLVDKYGVSIVRDKGGYHLRVGYADGNESREASGVLWQREGLQRGGEPMFGDVSTYRQRDAMNRGKCQVCGTVITSKLKPWIIEKFEIEAGRLDRIARGQDWHDYHLTTTPPVCEDCIPLAAELCPHLKKHGYQILDVLEYEVWGVFGEVVFLEKDADGNPVPRRTQMSIGYNEDYGESFSFESVLAKQQIVKITKFKVREDKTKD